MLKVNADNEYKAVERVYSGSTEIDKILDKNGNVLFAVNKEVEGTPALTYTGKEETNLKNYRIYGQTVDGESVGDLITEGEHAGEYCVPLTVEGENLYEITKFYDDSVSKTVFGITFTISNNKVIYSGTTTDTFPQVSSPELPLIPGQSYYAKIIVKGSYGGQVYIFFRGSQVEGGTIQNYKQIIYGTEEVFTAWYNTSVLYVAQGNNRHFDASVELVITKAPSVTTPIYLPEPLKMVGDEAEYIDYREQKQHRVRKNLWSGVVEQGNVSQDGVYGSDNKRIRSKNVPIEPGTYMISSNVLMRIIYAYNDDQKIGVCLNSAEGVYSRSFTVPVGANNIAISMLKRVDGVQVDITPSDFIWGQIEKGSEATTYEPYIEDTELDVTLPALPVLPGTNTLTVGTEVQPSNVYLKGRIREVS